MAYASLVRCAVVLPVLAGLAILASACGEPQPPPPKAPQKDDGVPANSLSDARLHGEEEKSDATDSEPKADPTQPYMTKVGEASSPEMSSSGSATKSGGAAGRKGGSGNETGSGAKEPSTGSSKAGVVSRSDCDRVMDKYIELEIASNPQLKGVPPEIIEQAKQMAREKHGEAPCTATRAQYTCAMAATSTGAWQRCMK